MSSLIEHTKTCMDCVTRATPRDVLRSLLQEQVTPTSVTGTFAERSPFQSTRPTELTSQSLESQQSLGGSSFQGTLTNRHFVLPIPETCQS